MSMVPCSPPGVAVLSGRIFRTPRRIFVLHSVCWDRCCAIDKAYLLWYSWALIAQIRRSRESHGTGTLTTTRPNVAFI